MRPQSARAFAPATVSNIGPGFDVLGLAINAPGDVAVARTQRARGLTFALRTTQRGVPSDAKRNVAAHVVSLLLDERKPPFGVRLTLYKNMPVGSGLGSSAASAVAALVAVNALLPTPLPRRDLLRFAVEGERLASGAPHADNAAPSLLGGVQLIRSYDPLDVVSLPVKNTFYWVVVHPHVVVKTAAARAVLPTRIGLYTARQQWGNLGGLVAGLITGNADLIRSSVVDVVAEPKRAPLTPGFTEVKAAALNAGALGCSLSGSGPSVFAIANSPRAASTIARIMRRTFVMVAELKSDAYISRINMKGGMVWYG
jgi:homoserine kinase